MIYTTCDTHGSILQPYSWTAITKILTFLTSIRSGNEMAVKSSKLGRQSFIYYVGNTDCEGL